jgi:hypothetical protein
MKRPGVPHRRPAAERAKRAAALAGGPDGAGQADAKPAAALAGGPDRPGQADAPALARARQVAAAGLLGGACCAWAAWPATGAAQTALLVIAAGCVAADLMRLATPEAAVGMADAFSSITVRLWSWGNGLIRQLPLAEGAALAALILEATHPSRPWHTGLLGAALLCYLLATHLAESSAPARVLRPQLPALAAGLGLLILGVGAAMLPATAPGLGSGSLRVLAAVAAIIVGALALPL